MTINKMEMPSQIFYGDNALDKVGEITSKYGDKALIVSDTVMEKLGNIIKLQEILSHSHISSVVYLNDGSEPTDQHVEEALDVLHKNQCQFIITIGGGSCIDIGKAVSALATNKGHISDFYRNARIAEKSGLPLIIIPTTAGTGSEVTNVTVISNTKTDVKMMLKQHVFLPDVAIVDPRLTMSAPPKVTMSAGMDALCHAIESYVSTVSHPLTRIFSLDAAKLILNNIKIAYDDPTNVEARTNMSIAALEAGIAFSCASVTLIHGMSRPIGAMFHVPHGISNAMLIGGWLEFTRASAEDKLSELSRHCFSSQVTSGKTNQELVDLLVDKIYALGRHMEIPNMREYGIDYDQFLKSLDKMAQDAIDSGSPDYNPRIPTHEEIVSLYQRCYDFKY